jgi:hypothetical protein
MKRNQIDIFIAAIVVLIAASSRIANSAMHIHNFAPLIALGLFSGAVIKNKRLALLTAISGQLIADVYFHLFTQTPGFYDIISQSFNYGALLTAAGLGFFLKKPNIPNGLVYTFAASTLFFIISNLGVWLAGWNGSGFTALVKTFILGVPFFNYTLVGNMTGALIFFAVYAKIQQSIKAKMLKA